VATGFVESQMMKGWSFSTGSVEDDHLPGRLALTHQIKGVVHLIELDTR
jgi:hypothetical protein